MLVILIGLVSSYITKIKSETTFTITFISLAISLSCYIISLLIASMITQLSFVILNNKNPFILILSIIFETFFIHNFFKLKRFSKGFSF